MKKVLLSTVFIIGLLNITGCYKDSDNPSEIMVVTERPDIKIGTSVHGVVTDLEGTLLDSYVIEVNGESIAIDQEVFYLRLNGANKKNQHLSIMVDGKEIAFANTSLIENDNNKVNIITLPEWSTSQINNTNSNITLNNNYQIEIKSSELSNNQEVKHGVISDPKLLQQLGLWGTDSAEQDYYLTSNTAFFIDAENMTAGPNTLQLSYDLTSLSQNTNLFHLNEGFHQWVLIDQLGADNGTIVLPEFGYYMIAEKTPAAFVEGSLSYENLPLSFQPIDLSLHNEQTLQLKATANGRWSSFLPKDLLSVLSISDPCNELIVEEELMILADDQTFATALTAANTENLISLNFQNIDCDGSLVNVPGALVDFGSSESLMIFSNTPAKIAVLSCGEINISGFDIINNNLGSSIPWSSEIDDVLEYLSVCEDLTEGFSFLKINGEMQILEPFTVEKENGKSILRSVDNDIRLIIKGEQVGEYIENEVNFFIDKADFGQQGYRMYCENSPVGCGIDDCYISHYEDLGDGLTRVSFSGTLWMQTIENPTAGNYDIEGQIITTL